MFYQSDHYEILQLFKFNQAHVLSVHDFTSQNKMHLTAHKRKQKTLINQFQQSTL